MSGLFNCGLCDFLVGLIRRVMCVRNRRGSNGSCYREAGGEEAMRMKPLPSINSATDDSTTDYSITTYSLFVDLSGSRLTFSEELELILEEDAPLRARNRPMGAFLTIKRQPRSREGYGMSANALADSCYPKLTEVLLSRAGLWEFDTFNLDRATGGHCIPAIGMYLLQKYQLIQHFNLKPENCMKLFSFIEAYYHNKNRYHNDVHATDVTQSLHIFLQEAALLPILRKTEILAVLLAALTHDLDHPGVSKSFLILTKHPIAVMYKDQEMDNQTASGEPGTSSGVFRRKKKETEGSILECHHWKMAYSCILQSGIFSHMSTRLPEIKKLLKDLIMATDISRQDEYLKLFKSFLTLKNLDMRLPEHRLLVLQIALKTADISNPGRPWSISHKWSYMVCEEFFLQGDMERQMQIPISPFCDRENDNIPHIQIGFFNNVVKPLYTAWHRYLRSELTLKMMTNLVHNTAEWKREADRCQLAQAKARENEKQKQLNHSASTECLLQEAGTHAPRISPRRSSYSPTRASAVKDALRRFSSPLQALVNAPRILSEARRTLRRSTEETRRSRTLSHLELAMAVSADRAHRALRRGSRSQERSHSPLHRPAAKTPSRAFTSSSQVHGSPRSYAARDDSINGVEKSRLGSILLAEYDSGSRYTTSPSVSNSYGPQRLSTVTDSLSVTPSSETRFEFPLALDNGKTERADGNTHGSSRNPRNVASIEQATFLGLRIDMLKIPLPSGAAGSSEAVFEPRKESCDILTCLVPEVTRRRGSAPVVATHMPRSQTAYADSRKLSASFAACHQIREDKPLVRRGSLPVMTGISAL